MPDISSRTTRRALLTAAAAGVAGLATQAALPAAALGADGDSVKLGELNTETTSTRIQSSGLGVDVLALRAGAATGAALVAETSGEAAVYAANHAGSALPPQPKVSTVAVGVYGFAAGVYETGRRGGAGVWGDSDAIGVVGSGGETGVRGRGQQGVVGDGLGAGGVGVVGYAGEGRGVGVHASAGTNDQVALKVTGKAVFSRSGRARIAAGRSSKVVSYPGVTAASLVFAVLSSNRGGRWVRAVIPAAGNFTIYLNAAVGNTSYATWWVLN
jgi:hypothetical protein